MSELLDEMENEIYPDVLKIGRIENKTLTDKQKNIINNMSNDNFITLFCIVFHADSVLSDDDLFKIQKECNKTYGYYCNRDTKEPDFSKPITKPQAWYFETAILLSPLSSLKNNKEYPYNECWLNHYKRLFLRAEKSKPITTYTPAENNIMTYYPQFKKDYQTLIDNGYMQKVNNELQWLKKQKALAQYFNYIKPESLKKNKWHEIEILFSECNLAQALQANNGKESKDFSELKKLIGK